jgi:glycosyltransferase involved in cell wall biosynthesis
MDITVLVCTYNRAGVLQTALNSIAASVLPASCRWEVLVVDNNSSDETAEVLKRFCGQDRERFRYLFEAEQGLSHARNAGIREARGDIIAFSDDDVSVEPTWLQNLTAALRDGVYAGAGGRILPKWTNSPPPWLPVKDRHGLAPLTVFDPGLTAGDLKEAPIGANMAFQRIVFETYGGFRADLGRRPGTLIGNEDTEFGNRLLSAGERLRYEPSALIYHPVQEGRIRKEYFLSWSFDKARADILEAGASLHSVWQVRGIPLYLFRRLAVWTVRWVFAINPSNRFSNKIKVWTVAGTMLECYRHRIGSKQSVFPGVASRHL